MKDPCGICGGDGSFDKCNRCLPKGDPTRSDVICRDGMSNVIQVAMQLTGLDDADFATIEGQFTELLVSNIHDACRTVLTQNQCDDLAEGSASL